MSHTAFKNVSISGIAHIDAPITLTTNAINERLAPVMERLGITGDVLGMVAGIHERRLWNEGQQASDVATLAAVAAMEDANVTPGQIGLLVNTSVSRDYLEPSTASIVSGNLGLPDTCQNFDVANACLAFINGMDIASRMIENREIDYALVVDGETANLLYEKTLARIEDPNSTVEQFREELAALTLGSGAVAMVLTHATMAPDSPRYLGGVSRSATQWNTLCRGNLDRMVTDTKTLMIEGLKLAGKTMAAAKTDMGWNIDDIDQFVIHQVSKPHTQAIIQALGIDPDKVMTLFGDRGNLGPASVPTVLSYLKRAGKLVEGQRIALLGIGSGLNCTMAEIVWHTPISSLKIESDYLRAVAEANLALPGEAGTLFA